MPNLRNTTNRNRAANPCDSFGLFGYYIILRRNCKQKLNYLPISENFFEIFSVFARKVRHIARRQTQFARGGAKKTE